LCPQRHAGVCQPQAGHQVSLPSGA
jgi:hypothetical protein